MKWIWIILALIYLLSPYDLIPGFSAAGWLDDIIVVVMLYRYLSRLGRAAQAGRAPQDRKPDAGDSRDREASDSRDVPRTPHEILGVPPDAAPDEIKSAYRRLVSRYHPDKVTHLGKEFQELAEKRFKEIQEAYQRLIR